ncbi:PQ-loop-domain-containing protein [Mycena sanguinolenta]|nr:PQ-loop-domain-containing protein [Mycena sanguinolenta]
MLVNPVAENVFGTMGLVCWTVQLLPQLWKSWREKSTEGLSPWLVLSWAISSPFLGAYAIILNLNVPLILEPQLFGTFCLVSWCQCKHYASKRSWAAAAAMALALALVLGGFEVGLVYAVQTMFDAGSVAALRATQFIGIFGSVLLGLGFLPQYVDIWRRREVVGISCLLLTLDMLGGICMDLSLAFKNQLDIVTGITYSFIVVLEAIVLLAMIILNPRAERRRRRENAAKIDEKTEADAAGALFCPALNARVDSSCSTIKVEDPSLGSEIAGNGGIENKV